MPGSCGKSVNIAINKRAQYNFFIKETFIAGISLFGNEIKSVREGKISINSAFCFFNRNELFVKNMFIARYTCCYTPTVYDEYRDRKLLLNKDELQKIHRQLEKNMTIIPVRVFINERGLAKVELSLAKGKKKYEKKKCLKIRDLARKNKVDLEY